MALFAPRTGTQLRAELKSGADHLKDRVARGGSDLKNALHDGVSAL
jgi:gas vesicle protein